MKKLIILLAIVVISVVKVSAQNQKDLPPAKERAEMQTEIMKEKLSLTEEQIPKVMTINLDAAKRIDEVKKMTNRMSMFKEFRSTMQAKDEGLKAILTKDQYKLYQKSKEEMKKKAQQAMKERKQQ
ncbi:hypothetical protein EYV94_04860 [Puteibacter caeruleilacunae]|nr:hypothetical protein EYV94_04860 [Puteibacter caeruleilacunae]